jgi:endonuclease/exonuclease/phosphatase family metal-dependent hydrolase
MRVATYNVHKCRGIDWKVSPERVAAVLKEIDADAIALQEILESQAECLARETGLHLTFGAARELHGCPYGNAVLSRTIPVSSANLDLSVMGREQRFCLRVELVLNAPRSVQLFAIHLGTSFFERRKQAAKLLSDEILGQASVFGSRIVLGDFNEWTRGLTTEMLRQHLESSDVRLHLGRSRTYPGLTPFLHLDHIYHDREFRLQRLRLHRSRVALLASDHLPLVADFDL